MKSKYSSVNDAKEKLTVAINKELKILGSYEACTCPDGGPFGWDMHMHNALESFLQDPPDNWYITRRYKHECYDWTITEKNGKAT